MNWETPTFAEINMSAEIGGYQNDFGEREPDGPSPPRMPSPPPASDEAA